MGSMMTNGGAVKFLGTCDSVNTCDCCGRTGLKHTVALVLEDESEVYFGSTCAAKALKMPAKAVKDAAKAADRAAAAERERAAYVLRQAEDAAWQAFLDAGAPGVVDWQGKGARCRQIQALGGYAAARAAYLASQ